jgi:dolichyl-phosphate-mannose--protein O-mannosyl transferase
MIFWWKEEDQNWLMLASVFTALMLSTKYLGLFGAGIIGLLFIYIVITEKRRLSGKTIIALGLPFLIITLKGESMAGFSIATLECLCA